MHLVVYFYVFLYDCTLHKAVFVDKINVLYFLIRLYMDKRFAPCNNLLMKDIILS